MPLRTLGGTVGLSEYAFHVTDDFVDGHLRERARAYDGIYEYAPGGDVAPASYLTAQAYPTWATLPSHSTPAVSPGRLVVGSTDAIATPCVLSSGVWTADLGDVTGQLLWRFFETPAGTGYAVTVDDSGDVALARDDADGAHTTALTTLDTGSVSTPSGSSVSVTRERDGTMTAAVDGSTVATVRDGRYSVPARTALLGADGTVDVTRIDVR